MKANSDTLTILCTQKTSVFPPYFIGKKNKICRELKKMSTIDRRGKHIHTMDYD